MRKPERCHDFAVIPHDLPDGELETAIGNLVFEFNNLESVVYWTFVSGMQMHPLSAAAIWNELMFRKRLDIIDRFFKNTSYPEEIKDFWYDLRVFLEEISAKRNAIVHGQRSILFLPDERKIHQVIQPNALFNYGIDKKNYSIDTKEVQDTCLDIRAAANAVRKLNDSLSQDDVSALNNMAIRWRPKPQSPKRHPK
jgi:hypothetical protein